MASAIQTEGLVKSFTDQVVLDSMDLDVAQGRVFALLGPNGAGRTTTVHILSTLLRPDRGVARVGSHDVVREPATVRALIGVTGQFSAVDGNLTGEENLRLMGDLRHLGRREGRQRVNELLERFELTDAARKPLSTYSGGMRRRLDLAMTVDDRPQMVFLDEPTTGLDPAAAQRCGRSYASSSQLARRSCSPPKISTRPTSSPTASARACQEGAARPHTLSTWCPALCSSRWSEGAALCDLSRPGHDGRGYRAVPHYGHLAVGGAGGSCAGQHAAAGRRGGGHCDRSAAGQPAERDPYQAASGIRAQRMRYARVRCAHC
jgi:ABC-type Na+ transport system ATPase subunit NatA